MAAILSLPPHLLCGHCRPNQLTDIALSVGGPAGQPRNRLPVYANQLARGLGLHRQLVTGGREEERQSLGGTVQEFWTSSLCPGARISCYGQWYFEMCVVHLSLFRNCYVCGWL